MSEELKKKYLTLISWADWCGYADALNTELTAKQDSINRLANNNLDLIARIERLTSALAGIQRMAEDDIRDAAEGDCIYQIEADARAALEKTK